MNATPPPQNAVGRPVHNRDHWHAQLDLDYGSREGRTYPLRRAHHGPLRILKGFAAPKTAPDLWEQIIVHPPGGIATGDQIDINIQAGRDTNVLLTSPGAAKWYRSDVQRKGREDYASQQLTIRVDDNAGLEWLPLESIVFNGARARLSTTIDLAVTASLIFADLVCLGRPAGNLPWRQGSLHTGIRIFRAGRPLFVEKTIIDSDDPAHCDRSLTSPLAMNGQSAFGTLLAVPPTSNADQLPELVALLREHTDLKEAIEKGELAITALPGLLVIRWRANQAEQGWQLFRTAWSLTRPSLLGHPLQQPRIWHC